MKYDKLKALLERHRIERNEIIGIVNDYSGEDALCKARLSLILSGKRKITSRQLCGIVHALTTKEVPQSDIQEII